MRKTFTVIAALAIVGIAAITACNSNKAGKEQQPTKDSAAILKRGEYLVATTGCDDCHSPKRMGAHGPEIIPELRLSGFPHDGKHPTVDTNEVKKGWALFGPDLTTAVGPWGQSFAANITSDATGIGNWTEQQFLTGIRKGKLKGLEGSRSLLPPMPWFAYKNMNDDDLKAIYAYLKTVAPVNNIVPAPKPLSNLQ